MAEDTIRTYAPLSEGAFADLLDAFEHAGAQFDPADEDHPSKKHFAYGGGSLVIVHDVEGPIKIQVLSHSAELSDVWKRVEAIARPHLDGDGGTLWPDDPSSMMTDPDSGSGASAQKSQTVGATNPNYRGPYKGDPDRNDHKAARVRAANLKRKHARARVSGPETDKSHVYGPYKPETAQAFLDKVRAFGMSVSGTNPWYIVANQHGITLVATRDPQGNVTVTVSGKNFYVGYNKIWEKIDPLMPRADAKVSGDRRMVVSADETRWDVLSKKMIAIDAAVGDKVEDSAGKVLGIVGEDWTPPLTTDPQAHIDYLNRVYDSAAAAWQKAEALRPKRKRKPKRKSLMQCRPRATLPTTRATARRRRMKPSRRPRRPCPTNSIRFGTR